MKFKRGSSLSFGPFVKKSFLGESSPMQIPDFYMKKKLINKNMDIFTVLIILFSLLYLDETSLFENDEFFKYIYLMFVSLFTFILTILKISKISYQMYFFINKKSYLNWKIILEIVCYLIHPNIFLDDIEYPLTWKIPDKLLLTQINYLLIIFQISFLLFQFWKNKVSNYKNIYKEGESIVKNNLQHSINYFFFRSNFKNRPFELISLFLILFIFELSILLKIAESPLRDKNNEFSLIYWNNNIWTNFVTLLSIGYGNCIPHTFLGKFVAIMSGLGGQLIFSSVVVTLASLIKLDWIENIIFHKIEKKSISNKIENCSALIICKFFKCFDMYKKKDFYGYEYERYKLDKFLKKFKILKYTKKITDELN